MPQPSYDEIIREVLGRGVAAYPDEDADIQTLMQDPHMMEGMTSAIRRPNSDMMYNPQAYTTMDPPPGPRLDPIRRGERYDDTITRGQSGRINRDMIESQQILPRTPSIDPTQRPIDPDQDDIDMLFPGYSKTDPTVPNMQKLYRQMPMRPNPQPNAVPMTPEQYTQYNVPRQYEQPELDTMQQLMEFYKGGSEI